LLPDGQVLIAGGSSTLTNTPTAELYNSATETWTPTGNLNDGRVGHTATLLANGQVLVAGGNGNNDSSVTLATIELYNPLSGTWIFTGPMIQAREGHTATLLPNGQVLLAGGVTGTPSLTYLPIAEIYDPVSRSDTPTGTMSTPRTGDSATLLPNGKVLVTGGRGNATGFSTNSAEVFDISTGLWSVTNALSVARFSHTATLMANGKILVTGGSADVSYIGLSDTEIYDPTIAPTTGTWTNTGAMNLARDNFTMTLLPNGLVLVAGGENSGPNYSNAELYDPITGTWTITGSMNYARYSHTATLLPNGKVLVTGGGGSVLGMPYTELYDPTAGTWTTNGVMNSGRLGHTATLLHNGKVLVAGSGGSYSAELYDPNSSTWTVTGQMITPRNFHKAVLLPDGRVFVVGGAQGSSITNAEIYDPTTGQWSAAGATRTAQYIFTTATLLPSGWVLVAGEDANSVPVADLFDPASGNWTPAQPPKSIHFQPTATLLPSGKVLVAGSLGTPEIFDPATGLWTNTARLKQERSAHSATLLPDGSVLVAGGYFTSGLASAELYNVGLGFSDSWRPQIFSAASPLNLGGNLALTGTGFCATSEGSSGNGQDSPTDYPLVQLRSMENGQMKFLLATDWSANAFASRPVWNFPPGYALATVFVNGIQSTSSILNITVPVPAMTMLANARTLANGGFEFTFTNNPGAVLDVLASTNLSLPMSNWTALGGVTEIAPGQFQFDDPQAPNSAQRFYRLATP
jgi:N-acetylneuraminic acid mutarotase